MEAERIPPEAEKAAAQAIYLTGPIDATPEELAQAALTAAWPSLAQGTLDAVGRWLCDHESDNGASLYGSEFAARLHEDRDRILSEFASTQEREGAR